MKVSIDLVITSFLIDQNCIGLHFSDKNFMYGLCNKSGDVASGLRLFDMETIMVKNGCFSLLLTSNV